MDVKKKVLGWTAVVVLIVGMLIASVSLFISEPAGGGDDYQYLGKVDDIQFSCNIAGEYNTTIEVYPDVFVVAGKVDIPGNHNAFVWASLSGKHLLLRGLNNVCAKYVIIRHENMRGGR